MAEAVVSRGTAAEAGLNSLAAYLREISRTRLPTREQESALVERLTRGEKSARNELITSHLKIVVMVCLSHRDRGLALDELIAEGNLGLIRAAQNFDAAHGRFAPFAGWWIRQSIRTALGKQARFGSRIDER